MNEERSSVESEPDSHHSDIRSNAADPLLGSQTVSTHTESSRWKASPYWLIPIVLISSLCRGMILAPRVEVYNALACRTVGESQDIAPGAQFLSQFVAKCADSARAQAEAARIQASVTTTAAILSAITTGFWAKMGDTYGRKLPLAASVFAALIMDAGFLIVTHPPVPFFLEHGKKIIVLGSAFDGIFGGLSSFNGVIHAYGADASAHGSRSVIFSTLQGFVFLGLASGPFVGNFFSRIVGYDSDYKFAINMFYAGAVLLSLNVMFITLILPESLEKSARHAISVPTSRNSRMIWRTLLHFLSAVFSPIYVFLPRRVRHQNRRTSWDWNLTLVAIGILIYIISIGVYQVKYLYAKHVYDWTASQLGFFMSLLWVSRALNLLVLVPAIVYYFKGRTSSPARGPASNNEDMSTEAAFDSALTRLSLLIDATSDILIFFFASSSSALFVFLSCLTSFTSGGNPAMHSLSAVVLHQQGRSREIGQLFGALAVLNAAAHVISPGLYAFTYGATVEKSPRVIFVLAAALLGASICSFSAVRFRKGSDVVEEEDGSVERGSAPA